MAKIKVYGELESKSTAGILLRYPAIGDAPIIQIDLSTLANPILNTYYQHIGITDKYTNGIIYFYDGSKFNPLNGTATSINNEAYATKFIGTEAEYKTAYSLGQILVGTLVIIEDGDSVTEDNSTSAVLGKAILGQMILG